MKKSVRSLHLKSKKLLKLYSQWQETRQEDLQRRCLALLGQILAIEPQYTIRGEFKNAF